MRARAARGLAAMALAVGMALALLCGPAADALRHRQREADPSQSWDAVYLVCGARAQQRRLRALRQWMESARTPPPLVLVGNDAINSLWSRTHQRNLTRAEWALEELEPWLAALYGAGDDAPQARLLPGSFGNTDGEMRALAAVLRREPALRRIAIVTSRFHIRRALRRLDAHAPDGVMAAAAPGPAHWEDRAPWIVAGEYFKMLRDALGQSQTPFLSRAATDGTQPGDANAPAESGLAPARDKDVH